MKIERFLSPYSVKIIESEEKAIDIVSQWHQDGLIVVAKDGVMDIPTVWHPEDLRVAANLGDKLLLRIDSDEYVASFKDPRGPINPWTTRAMMAAHYPYVDLIVVKNDESTDWLERLMPDIIVKSITSYAGIAQDLESLSSYLESTGAQLVVFDENSNIVPLEEVDKRAREYEAAKDKEGYTSGTSIRKKIASRILEDIGYNPINQESLSPSNPDIS